MVRKRSFNELIKSYIFKEKYQKVLIFVFEQFDSLIINNKEGKDSDGNSIITLQRKIFELINKENLLFNDKYNKQIEWLSIFSDKNSSVRPNGHEIDLNKDKEIENIANPRIKRLANYRLKYVDKRLNEIDKENLEKKIKMIKKLK